MGCTDAVSGRWREFILASPAWTAKLAVVRADGSPISTSRTNSSWTNWSQTD